MAIMKYVAQSVKTYLNYSLGHLNIEDNILYNFADDS